MEINQTHEKIISILKEKGPSLPIQISREINMSSLFISAFLSELASEKRIKVSSLKVGGSPLYFLEGQEQQLENFYKYLHPKEAEAFLLLKKNKILKDNEQEPPIRVALRAIKDFALPINKNNEIFWKYLLIPESEIKEILEPKTRKITKKLTIKPKIKAIKRKISISKDHEFQNPLVIKEKPKKQKPKSKFVQNIISLINNNQWKIIEEKIYKPKEYNCIIKIQSQLGPINFLTQAKDKKNVSETDLKKLVSNAQKIPLPALMLFTGNISKKALEYHKKYSSILKIKNIA